MNDAAIERPDSPPPFDALLPQPLFPSFIFTIFPRGGYVNKCVRLGDNRRRWKKGGRVRGKRGGSAGPLTSDANRLQAIVAEREEGVNGLIYRSPRLTNFFCCLPRWEALCEERWPLPAILKRASTLSIAELPSFLNAKLQLDKKRLSVSAALLHDCNSRRRRRQNEKCPGTKLGLFLPSLSSIRSERHASFFPRRTRKCIVDIPPSLAVV